ncbi:MAG: hypothetical protein JWN08_3373 [Frankiales bacterium]|nr:hypothetical protein [Frankiales bacterium]
MQQLLHVAVIRRPALPDAQTRLAQHRSLPVVTLEHRQLSGRQAAQGVGQLRSAGQHRGQLRALPPWCVARAPRRGRACARARRAGCARARGPPGGRARGGRAGTAAPSPAAAAPSQSPAGGPAGRPAPQAARRDRRQGPAPAGRPRRRRQPAVPRLRAQPAAPQAGRRQPSACSAQTRASRARSSRSLAACRSGRNDSSRTNWSAASRPASWPEARGRGHRSAGAAVAGIPPAVARRCGAPVSPSRRRARSVRAPNVPAAPGGYLRGAAGSQEGAAMAAGASGVVAR